MIGRVQPALIDVSVPGAAYVAPPGSEPLIMSASGPVTAGAAVTSVSEERT